MPISKNQTMWAVSQRNMYGQPISADDVRELLRRAYAAFNARDIDAVLSMMHPNVEWPNAMEGGYVYGHDGVREYWTRQWGLCSLLNSARAAEQVQRQAERPPADALEHCSAVSRYSPY